MIASSQFIDVNGLRLHYLDYGSPAKPPLVCIHGLSGNAHNFDYLAPHLAPDWHVMALDVRGRGDSAWGPPGDYNQQVYASDLKGMLDALGVARVTLIGTSMGGVVSMMFAGGYPDRVERLVLNDVGPEIDPTGLGRITAYMTSSPSSFATIADVTQYYRDNYPPLRQMPGPALIDFVKWSVRPAPDGRLVWKLDPAIRNIRRTARPHVRWICGCPTRELLRPCWSCAVLKAISCRAGRPTGCGSCSAAPRWSSCPNLATRRR